MSDDAEAVLAKLVDGGYVVDSVDRVVSEILKRLRQ